MTWAVVSLFPAVFDDRRGGASACSEHGSTGDTVSDQRSGKPAGHDAKSRSLGGFAHNGMPTKEASRGNYRHTTQLCIESTCTGWAKLTSNAKRHQTK